jgi:hypothetical protein
VSNRVPGHGAKSHTSNALSGRQPDRARCGTAPLISEPDTSVPGLGCLRSSAPPARARREEYHPLPTDPNPAGTTRNPGGCLQPVLLRGRVDHIDGATGELLHRYTTVHEPGGVLADRV